jgi:hypothetical protein
MRSWVGLRRRQGLALVFLVALAINQIRVAMEGWGSFVLRHPGFADFGNYYLYALVGLHQGWSRLYDLAAQQQEWLRLGGPDVIPWFPIIYPPPLAWLVVPFTLLPMPLAFASWAALLFGLVLLTCRLVARGHTRLDRWTPVVAVLAVYPVLFALLLGQVLIVELAAVAGAWWLITRGREIPAGLLLTALVFKPQMAILLPLVLLVIGRWRAVGVWLAGSALIAVIAVLTTGLSGLREYTLRLADAAAVAPQFLVPTQFTLAGLLGHGVLTIVVSAVVVALTIGVAYRHRLEGSAIPVAAALIGSMLITPYLHYQDLSALLLAGAIALHGRLDRWQRGLLVVGYLLLLATSYWGWGFGLFSVVLGSTLVLTEAAWLLAGLRVRTSSGAARRTEPFGQVPLDRTA